MAGKFGKVSQIVAMIAAGIIPWAMADAQSADTLEGQIAAQYKVTKLGADSSGLTVIQEGTVLTIKKGGILSVPQADAGAPAGFRHALSISWNVGLTWWGIARRAASSARIGGTPFMNASSPMRRQRKYSPSALVCFLMLAAMGPRNP